MQWLSDISFLTGDIDKIFKEKGLHLGCNVLKAKVTERLLGNRG